MSMEKLADHIISVAQDNNLTITNLQLQKIMYFVLKIAKMDDLLTYNELQKIYDEKFQVWQYGPVVPKEYLRFKKFASEPIIGDFSQTSQYNIFDNIIIDLLKVSAFTLVNLSHRVPHWINNQDKINGFRSEVTYSLEDI